MFIYDFFAFCLKRMWSGFYDFSLTSNDKITQSTDSAEPVHCSAHALAAVGNDISAKGCYVTGTGACYGKSKIEQDKLYYELEIRSDLEKVLVGVSNTIPDSSEVIPGHNVEVLGVKSGDVLSMTYDQANYPTFSVYLNGIFHNNCSGMKGSLHPYVSLPTQGEVAWRFSDVINKRSNPDFANFDNYMTARSVI